MFNSRFLRVCTAAWYSTGRCHQMHLTGSSEPPTDVVVSYVALQHVPQVERVEIGNRGLLEIEDP